MKQRVQLIKRIHRVAELIEKQAQQALSAAERAVDAARAALETLRRESAEAEARLLKDRALSGFAREMLWGHRTWFAKAELEALDEVARLEGLAREARAVLEASTREARLKEKLRERIIADYRAEHERKSNRELDEIGARRFATRDGS